MNEVMDVFRFKSSCKKKKNVVGNLNNIFFILSNEI